MRKGNPSWIKVPFWQKILLIICGLSCCMIILEIGLRLSGAVFLFCQEYGNKASFQQKNSYRILCLGESTTAVGGKNSYPNQLMDVLNERNNGLKFSVINKGICGVNTTNILDQLEDNLNRYNPDMVVTMMGINDFGAHIPQEDMRSKKGIFSFKTLRTYKLIRLLCLRIEDRIKGERRYSETEGGSAELRPKPFSLSRRVGYVTEQINPIQDGNQLNRSLASRFAQDEACVEMGGRYMGRGKYPQAEEAFKKAIELAPGNYWAYIGLGWCYSDQAKNPQAEEAFKKAIELAPGNYWAYIGLGWCYRDQAKNPQAEEAFKKAIESNPIEDRAYGCLAVLNDELGRRENAEEYYKKAGELRLEYCNPKTINNYLKLKEILDKRRIKLICVQYPMRSIEPLRRVFAGQDGVIMVDNERSFKEAVREEGYKQYFLDIFGGDFGHCTWKGNRLLADNISRVILGEITELDQKSSGK